MKITNGNIGLVALLIMFVLAFLGPCRSSYDESVEMDYLAEKISTEFHISPDKAMEILEFIEYEKKYHKRERDEHQGHFGDKVKAL